MILIGIGLSGFCALAYEVFWTRMLNLFLHNNIYSFTAILGTFLIGIAVGSLIYARFLTRHGQSRAAVHRAADRHLRDFLPDAVHLPPPARWTVPSISARP